MDYANNPLRIDVSQDDRMTNVENFFHHQDMPAAFNPSPNEACSITRMFTIADKGRSRHQVGS